MVALPGLSIDLARTIVHSPIAYFRQFLSNAVLSEVFNGPSLFQGQSETFNKTTLRVISTEEVDVRFALFQYSFDIPEPLKIPHPSRQSQFHFYDTLSFAPGVDNNTDAWLQKPTVGNCRKAGRGGRMPRFQKVA